MRIGTLNVWGLFGDWKSRKELLDKIWNKKLAPDFLCLQEVCISNQINQLHDLKEITGYEYHLFAPSHIYNDTVEGVAVFSQQEPSKYQVIDLPETSPENTTSRNTRRVALNVSFEGLPVSVVSSHLSFFPASDNRNQIEFLLQSLKDPVIVASDFNIKQTDFLRFMKKRPEWRIDGLYDVTWPNDINQFKTGWKEKTGLEPYFQIEPTQLDYIITNSPFKLKETKCQHLEENGIYVSDHAMLVNEYSF